MRFEKRNKKVRQMADSNSVPLDKKGGGGIYGKNIISQSIFLRNSTVYDFIHIKTTVLFFIQE